MKDLIKTLSKLGKSFYTIPDLLKITGFTRDSLYVTLSRLVQKKLLLRLNSGIYILAEKYDQLDSIANVLYQPSYLSFESALSRFGILSQVPYTLSFATTKKSQRKKLGDVLVEYKKIKPLLFFGYERTGDLYIATPEKALIDTLYFYSFGKTILTLQELNLKEINHKEVQKLVKPYPARTQNLIRKLFGSK
ncbi:MAG: hypothetical protein QME52_06655 [Bacteroidota bacterium]|nr:hypothetical protein [Bacteroidota bacterium]